MKKFIRCIFGDCTTGTINKDVHDTLNNKFSPSTIVYVWGENNFNYLKKIGINKNNELKLVDKNPYVWEKKYGLRHKIESYKISMFEDGFKEILFIDWDAQPIKNIDESKIWDELKQKDEIQAAAYCFKARYCAWRENGARTSLCSCLLYCRNKNLISDIIDCWVKMGDKEYMKNWPQADWALRFDMQTNDEWATSLAIDNKNKGWLGIDEWKKNNEIDFLRLKRLSPFGYKDDVIFIHG